MIRAIDLCSGAGGWACAARGLPIELLLAVDLWPAACSTYRLNHPDTQVWEGDLRDGALQTLVIEFCRAHRVNLILGGIPCEWISSYRSLKKVDATELAAQRATLDACLSITKAGGPCWWCFEDVVDLIKHLPIFTPYHVLNARHFSPQRRKRCFVGQFPIPPSPGDRRIMRDALRPGPYRIGRRSFNRIPQTHRTFSNSTTLAAYPDRKAPTVLNISSQRDAEMVIVDPSIPGGKRQIEWQESARLQGFPENYVFYGSPSDVAKQVGRAIQIETGRAILEGIVRAAAEGAAA